MSTTKIVFMVNTHGLPQGGSYERPAFTSHFAMRVTHEGSAPYTVQPGNPVNINSNDRVELALVDNSLGLDVEIAPVLLLAHQWNGEILTPELMNDSRNCPIDAPRFDVAHHNLPKMYYSGQETNWEQVEPENHLYWNEGAKISRNVSVERDDLYRPYATFNLQGLTGMLTYGVEFAVSKDGQHVGYYYFDPRIHAV